MSGLSGRFWKTDYKKNNKFPVFNGNIKICSQKKYDMQNTIRFIFVDKTDDNDNVDNDGFDRWCVSITLSKIDIYCSVIEGSNIPYDSKITNVDQNDKFVFIRWDSKTNLDFWAEFKFFSIDS